MSIFKETLADSIQTQLKARTLVISGEGNQKDPQLPWYLSKTAWVRMTSFVNFNEGPTITSGPEWESGIIKTDITKGNYKDDELSRKYILEGGTLYTRNNQTQGTLRYGVATPGAAYGGNIDLSGDNIDPNYFRQLGIRPMPGITSVSLRTKAAYGSLFDTTVNFHAWDTHQLNELEILFMRPGYSVLLEWGWSQYLNYNNDKLKNQLTRGQLQYQSFLGQTINPFNPSLTQNDIYKQLQDFREEYKHNYDGMLGYIKNFSWKLRKDGGYDCTVNLISMGEAISTVKMNTNSNSTLNINGISSNEINKLSSTAFYDDYENILLSIKSKVEKPVTFTTGSFEFQTLPETEYSGSWDYNLNYIAPSYIETQLRNNKYNAEADKIKTLPYYKPLINNPNAETTVGTRYEYIPLDVWIAILGSYCNLKTKDQTGKIEQTVRLMTPTDADYCLAGPDSITVDPSVCIVKTPKAFAPEFNSIYIQGYPTGSGINPPIYYFEDGTDTPSQILNQTTINFFDPVTGNGRIKNILLNIDFLLSTYKSMKKNDNEAGVVLMDYIQKVMNGVSNALGGLNNFKPSTAGRDQNSVKILDPYYLNKEPKDTFYEFDLFGLGSILKDVDLESQIFENQSTIVAIAAQSRANLGDVYNSTQVYLNAGIEDRIATAKGQGNEITSQNIENNPFFKNTPESQFYRKLLKLMLYARDYIVGPSKTNLNAYGESEGNDFPIYTPDGNSTPPDTILKQSLLRFDSEVNFKALIPFKLRIKLEGIGGIVVGQIFRVKQNILPKNYYGKDLGFVITQIDHDLNNNQWETTLTTQICLLDNPNFKGFLKQNREGFGNWIAKIKLTAILYPIVYDFIKYQAIKALTGYLYSSVDFYAGSQVIEQYLFNYSEDDVNKFWKDNITGFLNQGANGEASLSGYTNDRFQDFLVAWIDKYKELYPDNLNLKFTENITLDEALSWIANKNYSIPPADAPEFYKGFNNDLLVEIQSALNSNLELYYPNTNKKSIYYGNDKTPRVRNIIRKFTKELEGQIFQGYTLDEQNLRARINNFFETATVNRILADGKTQQVEILKNLKDAYDVSLALENKAINRLFTPDSKIMYSDAKSLIHSQPLTFGIWSVSSKSSETKSKEKNIAFAKGISWAVEHNRSNGYRQIEKFNIKINKMGELITIGIIPTGGKNYNPIPSGQVNTFINGSNPGDRGSIGGPSFPWN